MTRADILRRSRLVIGRELLVNPLKVAEQSDFRADLAADSLDMVDVHRAIEDEFGVTLSDEQCAFCQTVGTLVDLIENKLEAAASGGRGRVSSSMGGRQPA